MEGNNNQPVTPTPEAPVAPVVPEVPVTPEAPVAPVAPEVPVTPEAPVAPVAPEVPVAPEAPVAPVAPEVGVTPVAPVAPVTPEVGVTPETPVAPAAPEVPVGDPNMTVPAAAAPEAMPAEPEKKRSQVVPIIIIIVCLVGIVAYLVVPKLLKKDDPTPTPTPNPTPVTPEATNLDVSGVTINGTTFNLPVDKVQLDAFGWAWGVDTTTTEVQPGEMATGIKFGSEAGGAEVSAKNTGSEVVMLDDCKIFNMVFHNPGDGSENVTFVGGLDYSTTPGTLTAKMSELGFKNGREDNGVYTYYKGDNQSNAEDYIMFTFNGEVLTTVTLNASVN
jgi:hypothetical protein